MNTCENCSGISVCPLCGSNITFFKHVGVRGTVSSFKIPLAGFDVKYDSQPSGVWHYANPCGHRVNVRQGSASLKYNGGPLWKDGYSWLNVFWGSYYSSPTATAWINNVDRATANIEANQSYSGGLSQYNVGIGRLAGHVVIPQDPPATVANTDIAKQLQDWVKSGKLSDLGQKGAYNIFLPPGITATLSGEQSCSTFCDYHDSANGKNGPFYTVEPYPCATGCNQCTSNPFDTLTTGLSEEMVELKTDMDPGTGWVIGNEEICDFCDANYVCKTISTGEYVNSWYDMKAGACWKSQ